MQQIRAGESIAIPDYQWSKGLHVDLGAGALPRNPTRCKELLAVDILEKAPFAETELQKYVRVEPGVRLPIESASVDSVSGFDFLEHLPRWAIGHDGKAVNLFIQCMNEVSRILRPGGHFIAVTPCYPAAGTFVDPTHVNPIAEGTVDYFAGPMHARGLGYGFDGNFSKVQVGWLANGHALWKTQDLQGRSAELNWPLAVTPDLRTRFRRHVGATLRRFGMLDQSQHLLWVLQRDA